MINDDRTLVKILDNKTFICRNPQLGYEELNVYELP